MRLGYTSSFTIYDTDDSRALVKQIMGTFGISAQDIPPRSIRNRISAAKNALVRPSEFRKSVRNLFDEQVATVYEEYEKRIRANNAMDFDDLLTRTIELFEKNSDVLKKWSSRFNYILIDEYQDTNRAQYRVITMLTANQKNLTVVGDDAQSIYRFRGADIRNMLDFERDYPGLSIFRLEQNYRSTGTILAAASDVIKQNRSQIEKKLWTENESGDLIDVMTLRDERDEGSELVRLISTKRDDGTSLNEIAVLYRTNAQSLSIEDALRRANIPYTLVGGVAYYQRTEVKDLLAYLKLIINPRDDESFLRSVNRPARGIGEVTVRRLRNGAERENLSLLEMAGRATQIEDLSPRAKKSLHGFAEMVARWQSHLEDVPLPEFARAVATESGLIASLKEDGSPEGLARWENVERLLSHIVEYVEEIPEARLENYLQEIALLSEIDNYDQSEERVTLMTIHAAKGLEFEFVLLPGLEEGLFPIGQTGSDEEELEEERRLFYVAVTRAKRVLTITNCERRYRFGELSYPTPSRFLTEIGQEHLRYNSTAPRPAANLPRAESPTLRGSGRGNSFGSRSDRRIIPSPRLPRERPRKLGPIQYQRMTIHRFQKRCKWVPKSSTLRSVVEGLCR